MKKRYSIILTLLSIMIFLSGCAVTNEKTASVTIIYGVCTALSLVLLVCYSYAVRKKDVWFLLLFSAILLANIGYLSLSVSQNLEEALLANRIVYLGSVFLPMSVLMIVLRLTKIKYPKWLPGLLTVIVTCVFLVAASPGYSDIYYKEVSFEIVNGVPTLHKVYGFCHDLYLLYILAYFVFMIALIAYIFAKKKTSSVSHAIAMATALGINITIWLLERYIYIEFELLTITYILTGMFLLGLHMMILENERLRALAGVSTANSIVTDNADSDILTITAPVSNSANNYNPEQFDAFLNGLKELTPTEQTIYDYYINGKNTSEIMIALNIKENTLKFHNKNIYGKLNVSSRKQLLDIYKQLNQSGKYPKR